MTKSFLKTIVVGGAIALATTASASAAVSEWAEHTNQIDPLSPIGSPAIEFAALYGVAIFAGVLVVACLGAVVEITFQAVRNKRVKNH